MGDYCYYKNYVDDIRSKSAPGTGTWQRSQRILGPKEVDGGSVVRATLDEAAPPILLSLHSRGGLPQPLYIRYLKDTKYPVGTSTPTVHIHDGHLFHPEDKNPLPFL